MKRKTALGAVAGGAVMAAAGNRLLARRAGELENPLGGTERTYRWRGVDVAYAEAGSPDDPDLLLLHGLHAAASNYEFEPVFELLAERHHVIAPDLPGFGRSDRPPLVYSPTIYEEFVREFARDVAEEPIVVASSLTGAFADEADVDRLVLVCPTDGRDDRRPWLRTVLRTPLVGTALFNVVASKRSIRRFLARVGYYDASNVDPEAVAYAWRSAHQPGARYAPASLVAGTLESDRDLASTLSALETPVTLVWGRDAELVPLREGRELADAVDAELVVVDYATQWPHAEHPERFVEYLAAELPRVDGE